MSWSWSDPAGAWHPYAPLENAVLEQALQAYVATGDRLVRVNAEHTVDLGTMQSTRPRPSPSLASLPPSSSSSSSSPVRRVEDAADRPRAGPTRLAAAEADALWVEARRFAAACLKAGPVLDVGRPADGGPWKALLVGDLHLGQTPGASYFTDAAQLRAIEALPGIVRSQGVRQAFVLGDLFHSTASLDTQWSADRIARIVELLSPLPVYIIGGNHDRYWFSSCADKWRTAVGPTLRVFSGAELLLALRSSTGARVLLTHDGGNNLRLLPGQVAPFVLGLKIANGLERSEWLVTAHTHSAVLVDKWRCASVGSFGANGEWGVIEELGSGDFTFTHGTI
eukprot:m51a1_g14555 hypothetical protein (338) ;mRNA; r:1015689-1017515